MVFLVDRRKKLAVVSDTKRTVAPLALSKAGARCAPYKKWWAVPTLQMYKVEIRACLNSQKGAGRIAITL